jgi:hypothetical protein
LRWRYGAPYGTPYGGLYVTDYTAFWAHSSEYNIIIITYMIVSFGDDLPILNFLVWINFKWYLDN